MPEPELNEIFEDPQLMVQYKDLVIDLYNQLKNNRIEAKYQAMLTVHQQLSQAVIDKIRILINQWVDLSYQLGNEQDAKNLRISGDDLIAGIQLASKITYNINITNVQNGANQVAAILSRLLQEARSNPDIVNPKAESLNNASDNLTTASTTYINYWNTQFKDISDNWQVLNMIRDAVVRASNAEFRDLVVQQETLLTEIGALRERYNELLKEWSQGLGATRKMQFPNDLLSIRRQIADKEVELNNIKARLVNDNNNIQQLLRDFGIQNP